jgi:hypothetical protein
MRSRGLSEHDVALDARLHFSLLHRWCASWSYSAAPLGAFVRARLHQWLLRVEVDAPRAPSWVPPRAPGTLRLLSLGAQARRNDFARRVADTRTPSSLNRRCCGLCGAFSHSRAGHVRAMAGDPEARRAAVTVATGVSAALHRRVHARFEDGDVRLGTMVDARASNEWRVLYDADGGSEWLSLPDEQVRVGGVDRRSRQRSAIPAPLRLTVYSEFDAAELRCGADVREVRAAVERVAESNAEGEAEGDAEPRLLGLRASSSVWSRSLVSRASLSLSRESLSGGALGFMLPSAGGATPRDGATLVGRCVRLSPLLQRTYFQKKMGSYKINAFTLRDGVASYKVTLASAAPSANAAGHWLDATLLVGATFDVESEFARVRVHRPPHRKNFVRVRRASDAIQGVPPASASGAGSGDGEHDKKRKRKRSSPYVGVSWSTSTSQAWKAEISYRGLRHDLGFFYDDRDAARAYDNIVRAEKLSRPLNFPADEAAVASAAAPANDMVAFDGRGNEAEKKEETDDAKEGAKEGSKEVIKEGTKEGATEGANGDRDDDDDVPRRGATVFVVRVLDFVVRKAAVLERRYVHGGKRVAWLSVQFEDGTPSRCVRVSACWSTVSKAACYAACCVANTAAERAESCSNDVGPMRINGVALEDLGGGQPTPGYSLRRKSKRRRPSDGALQTRGGRLAREDENGFTSPTVPWQTEDLSLEDALLAAQSECWDASSMDAYSAQLMHWHLANLEYACAAELREVSNAHWDQVRVAHAAARSCGLGLPLSPPPPPPPHTHACARAHPPPLSLSLSTGRSRFIRATSTIWEAST